MADLRSVKTSGRFDLRSDDAAQFLVFRDNSDRFSPRQQRASTQPLLGHQLFQNRRSAIADRHYLTKIRNILSNPRIIGQSRSSAEAATTVCVQALLPQALARRSAFRVFEMR